jgi:hypothetical protein
MKKLISTILVAVMMITGLSVVVPAIGAYAATVPGGNIDIDNVAGSAKTDLMPVVTLIINAIIGVVGLVAVIMIILGGVKYTTSSGDATKVSNAKNTIMYGIVGLIIVVLAFAIVNFVIGSLG